MADTEVAATTAGFSVGALWPSWPESLNVLLHGCFERDVFFLAPLLVALDCECACEPQQAVFIRKDADHACGTAHLHVIMLHSIRGPQAFVVIGRQTEKRQRFMRGFFQPASQPGVRACRAAFLSTARAGLPLPCETVLSTHRATPS